MFFAFFVFIFVGNLTVQMSSKCSPDMLPRVAKDERTVMCFGKNTCVKFHLNMNYSGVEHEWIQCYEYSKEYILKLSLKGGCRKQSYVLIEWECFNQRLPGTTLGFSPGTLFCFLFIHSLSIHHFVHWQYLINKYLLNEFFSYRWQ